MLGAGTDKGAAPIFLAGVDRSGIGLIGEVLECHPSVSMTRRTNYWSYYAGRFGDLAQPAQLEAALDAMMANSRMRVFDPDRQRLIDDFYRGPTSYERLFELMQTQLMERRGATRWGDKSLGSEDYAATILEAFPSALMLHLMRDPRDRYTSQKLHRGPVRGAAGQGAALWQRSSRLALANQNRFKGRYLVVRYEDLVSAPYECLEEVRTFLELDKIEPFDPPFATPLTTSSIGRYKSELPDEELRYLESATRAHRQHWGYADYPATLRRSTAVRYNLLTRPVYMGAGARWRLVSKIRRRRGLSPSKRRLATDRREPKR